MEPTQLIKNLPIPVSEYRDLEKIGEGGYGQVFKAEQVSTGQTVAIKTVKFSNDSDHQRKKQLIARFEREARLCAEINHPNIVKLIDKGHSEEGAPYVVFEHVEGETLRKLLLREHQLSPQQMADIMEQVLNALACAHEKGIVHRDLKPQNIMVSRMGPKWHTKILDFGIGAFTNDFRTTDYQSLTITRDVLGTPAYSAPEQLRGEPPTIKSDLYSWGLMLIECLTGQQVMAGATIAEIFQQQLMASNVPIPAALLGHPVAEILRKVLEKNPRNRAGDSMELADAFARINFNTLTGDISKPPAFNSDSPTLIHANTFRSVTGERKQMTTLCLRLSLVADDNSPIDLEVQDTIQQDQMNLCKDTAVRYGGFVSETFMNNMAVYFGYPESDDTDARRAGRTALELVNEVRKRSALLHDHHGVQVHIQMGLHSGPVLVQRNRLPEGNVPNTAYALAHAAAPGTALVSNTSYKLLEPYLEFEETSEIHLSVQDKKIEGNRLLAERKTDALSSLRPWSANRQMVGRDSEKDRIMEAWKSVSTRGGAVLVTGQAGIGKSKLTYDIKKEVGSTGGISRECRCLVEHQNNALFPFLNLLRQEWELPKVKNEQAAAVLKMQLTAAGCSVEASLPLLCSWLSLPVPEEYAILDGTPEQQKKRIFSTLKQSLLHLERDASLLLVVEDLHWLDPTSLEFLNYLLTNIEEHPLLLLMTARPAFEHPWPEESVKQLPLGVLSEDSVGTLVKDSLLGKLITDRALAYICERADGIPLFAEELTRMLIEEKHLIVSGDLFDLKENFDSSAVPITLHDLLNGRLGRLGLAKETARLAATIGREFDYELLAEASPKDPAIVQQDLDVLASADVIYRQRTDDPNSYIFRHALIRDAAYDGMLRVVQEKTHNRIAVALEDHFPENIQENAFEIARHFGSGKMYDQAIAYGAKAAKSSLDRYANQEVVDYSKTLQEWIGQLDKEEKSDKSVHEQVMELVRELLQERRRLRARWQFRKWLRQAEEKRFLPGGGTELMSEMTEKEKERLRLQLQQMKLKSQEFHILLKELQKESQLQLQKERKKDNHRLLIYCIRTNALMNTSGWASSEVEDSALHAYDLIQERGHVCFEHGNLISAYWALFTYYNVASARQKVNTLTLEFLKLAESKNDIDLTISAKVLRGIALFNSGSSENLAEANTLLLEVMSLRKEFENHEPSYTVGIENFCWAAGTLGLCQWLTDQKEEGRKYLDWAVAHAKKIDHAPSLCLMLFYRGIGHQWDRNKTATIQVTNEAIAISEKYYLLAYGAYAKVLNHWAKDEIEIVDAIVEQLKAMGCYLGRANFLSLPAALEFERGETEKAISRIDQCLAFCEEHQEKYYQSELLKMKAAFSAQ